jgi:antitoxin component of MazEF toxin-antitoxin module
MIKKLTKHGNSLALVIDKAILKLLDIDAETQLSLDTDGHNLIISPSTPADRERRFKKAQEKINRKYGKAFKRLAE